MQVSTLPTLVVGATLVEATPSDVTLPPGLIKPWFLTEGKLATVLFTFLLGSPQRCVKLAPSSTFSGAVAGEESNFRVSNLLPPSNTLFLAARSCCKGRLSLLTISLCYCFCCIFYFLLFAYFLPVCIFNFYLVLHFIPKTQKN